MDGCALVCFSRALFVSGARSERILIRESRGLTGVKCMPIYARLSIQPARKPCQINTRKSRNRGPASLSILARSHAESERIDSRGIKSPSISATSISVASFPLSPLSPSWRFLARWKNTAIFAKRRAVARRECGGDFTRSEIDRSRKFQSGRVRSRNKGVIEADAIARTEVPKRVLNEFQR